MSLFELLPKLRPRKFEPVFQRDLHQLFMDAKKLGPRRAYKDAKRIIRDDVFKAFLGGKLQATRELKERYSYSIGDYDLAVIQEMRQRYINDFNAILNDLFRGTEEQSKLLQRVWAVAVTATWEAYNKGKISTYRQDDEGKIRERGYAAQAQFEPVVYWITAADEKVCAHCSEREGRSWSLWRIVPAMPAHVGCRCEWQYVERPRAPPTYIAVEKSRESG